MCLDIWQYFNKYCFGDRRATFLFFYVTCLEIFKSRKNHLSSHNAALAVFFSVLFVLGEVLYMNKASFPKRHLPWLSYSGRESESQFQFLISGVFYSFHFLSIVSSRVQLLKERPCEYLEWEEYSHAAFGLHPSCLYLVGWTAWTESKWTGSRSPSFCILCNCFLTSFSKYLYKSDMSSWCRQSQLAESRMPVKSSFSKCSLRGHL